MNVHKDLEGVSLITAVEEKTAISIPIQILDTVICNSQMNLRGVSYELHQFRDYIGRIRTYMNGGIED